MVHCNYKEKMGTITITNHGKTFKINAYAGNCLMVLVYHNKKEKTNELYTFFNDLKHFKVLIGLEKDYKGKFENYYKEKIKKIQLNTFYKENLNIATLFTKAGFKVELYYKKIK